MPCAWPCHSLELVRPNFVLYFRLTWTPFENQLYKDIGGSFKGDPSYMDDTFESFGTTLYLGFSYSYHERRSHQNEHHSHPQTLPDQSHGWWDILSTREPLGLEFIFVLHCFMLYMELGMNFYFYWICVCDSKSMSKDAVNLILEPFTAPIFKLLIDSVHSEQSIDGFHNSCICNTQDLRVKN